MAAIKIITMTIVAIAMIAMNMVAKAMVNTKGVKTGRSMVREGRRDSK